MAQNPARKDFKDMFGANSEFNIDQLDNSMNNANREQAGSKYLKFNGQ